MDFTDAYRLSTSKSSHRSFAYSPGSTFFSTFHHLGNADTTVVQVRVSTSLQVIRTWTLDFQGTSSSWSRNGSLLLVVGKKEFVVLSVDPGANRRSAAAVAAATSRNHHDGVVARIKVGMEGLANASWVGNGNQEAICAISSDELMASIYNLQSGTVFSILNPKRSKAFPSPTKQHLAFLTRQNAKDGIIVLASPDSRKSLEWKIEVQTALHTNDCVELAWSPNERYLAIREGILEYKVQIYSPLGHLQSSLQIDSNPVNIHSSFASIDPGLSSEAARVAGGGLGIREMKWSPDSRLLALGGFDEVVRILESTEWSIAGNLDLSRKVVADSQEGGTMGALMAWREPYDWKNETGGRGIVEYERMDMPFTIPSLKIEMSSNSTSKSGICWIDWNHDGTLLAVRNDNHPAVIYIYAFPRINTEEEDQRIQPYLLSVIMLSSSVTLTAWKPVAAGNQSDHTTSCLAIINSQGQSIHLWSYRGSHSPSQIVEAVPIPLDDFQAVDFAYAPDGNKILITSENDTYCCAIEAQNEYDETLQESHL